MIFHNKNEDEQIVELEHKKRDYYNYIANEIKDIQTQAASLKNPEDKYKVLNTLLKINAFTQLSNSPCGIDVKPVPLKQLEK